MTRPGDRVALVTGAAQGIGAATARRLAADGVAVAVVDLQEPAARTVAEEIEAAGGRALAVGCDVTNWEQVEAAVAGAVEKFGRLDILVSNAGVTRDNLLFKMSDEDWNLVLATHLTGSFYCARAAQKPMVDQRYGRMIFLSSRSALGNRGQVNYATAKAGLQGMTRTLAIELGPFGVTVNAVAPGFIETAMTRSIVEKTGGSWEELTRAAAERVPLRRTGQPEEIASVIAFLASDDSSYLTGQILYATGGPTV
jgi:3-oxoacyl-[acyl-carrier protein] reductase